METISFEGVTDGNSGDEGDDERLMYVSVIR